MSEATLPAQPHAEKSVSAGAVADGVNWRAVALPVEHGAWGMLGEPLVLGLLVAPSWAGLGVAVASLAAFLAHHPLKLVVADWRRGVVQPRTVAARVCVVLYGTVAVTGVVFAARGSSGWWHPLAAAAPLALAQLAYTARNQGRALLPELLGGVALSSVVAAEMRAAGLPLAPSLAAWAVFAARAVGAVLYVRARLRLDRGLAPNRALPIVAHALGLILAVALSRAGHLPWLAAPAFALLLARAAYGLSPYRRRVAPRVVGMSELAYGIGFVAMLAL
jgi:hypothetical protein